MVSLNLDIRQFAQDVIERCESPDLLNAFWVAIAGRMPQHSNEEIKPGITVLDPTCGSGAFLFAALNILEPLYEACLERMKGFLEEWGEHPKHKNYASFFTALREDIGRHPSHRYFIYKSIIIHNLYGVDIMKEAVEICKLRLFLKLVAQVENGARIEPLPDIDFNIRAGNTLVGFATEKEMQDYFDRESKGQALLQFDTRLDEVKADAEEIEVCFNLFRQCQLGPAEKDGKNPLPAAKAKLDEKLRKLNARLNAYLAQDYGVDPSSPKKFATFLATHLPFHWFIEFYGIMKSGGFDAIVGNPPYIQRTKISDYTIHRYETAGCPDIYAACIERSLNLLVDRGRFAMIIPISFQFSLDFALARQVCTQHLAHVWVSAFSRNPAALFSAGLGVRNSICMGVIGRNQDTRIMTSRLYRWIEEGRPMLFQGITYAELPPVLQSDGWPRLDSPRMAELFGAFAEEGRLGVVASRGSHAVRFKTTALYYISAFAFDPPSYDQHGGAIAQTKIGSIRFNSEEFRNLALSIVLSKIAVLWWTATGDDFDVTASGLGSTPVNLTKLPNKVCQRLLKLSEEIQGCLSENVIYTKYAGKWMGNYDIKYVRHLTDEVDKLILEAFGLQDYWEDLELAYSHFMKATGERPGTRREMPVFSKRPR